MEPAHAFSRRQDIPYQSNTKGHPLSLLMAPSLIRAVPSTRESSNCPFTSQNYGKFYDASPRSVSPLPGASADELLNGCQCFYGETLSPTKKPTSSSTTNTADQTASATFTDEPTTDITTDATSTIVVVDNLTTTTATADVDTTTAALGANEDVSTTTVSPSLTTSAIPIATTHATTSATTSTTISTIAAAATSSTTSTSTTTVITSTTTTTPTTTTPTTMSVTTTTTSACVSLPVNTTSRYYNNGAKAYYTGTRSLSYNGFGTTQTGAHPTTYTTYSNASSIAASSVIGSCLSLAAYALDPSSTEFEANVHYETSMVS
ncbi:hypothetical protein K461DRAFT_302131 [Myriangium duriaei CBS 260.36]|uniref:Uncharacterized protein n=1 Tax=Myriangium duriaei CBS 260.36 TaxID=1168546 RepID=A0A9P4IU83_9PEZI|nr:hypothetical protein K461DRAFT_302131 [Myriangium duriaei CBS 260.36]